VAAGRTDLRLLCWAGYDDPSILAPFETEFGVRVHAEQLLSDFEAAERVATREHGRWDVVNLNNPFARDHLEPRGLVRALDRRRFEPLFDAMLPTLAGLRACARSRDGSALLGVCQRFGAFNLVVDTDAIAAAQAARDGFALANDPANAGRFGILAYDDFNVFHVAIGAGLDPFRSLDAHGVAAFEDTARRWFRAARLVTTDHLALNRALVAGDIRFYVSGGVYTCSCARAAGHRNVRAITPERGPIGGRGGIAFAEVTSVLAHPGTPAVAEDFLAYLLRPAVAVAAARAGGTLNPVMQMADPAVMGALSRAELDAIQWDTTEEEVARCAPYALAPDYATLHARLVAARRAAGWD
jgi:spermidine/putrescine transport system substrate-binding protein